MSSAAHQVLSTIELLEQVLLQLPFQSLISAHQVCHIWNATIRHSTTLQRELFLAPVPCRRGKHQNASLKDVPLNHGDLKKSPRIVKPQLNKLLAKKFRLGILNDPEEDYDGGYMPMVSYGGDTILRGDRAHDPKEASWRKMLITQPPARRVEIAVFHVEDGLTEKDCVSDEEGVRMGQMVEWVEQRPWRRDLKRRSMGWYFEL
ncbi:hypothetical protein BKA80DRAFT_313232 [Phyllosticta citrichinensis]